MTTVRHPSGRAGRLWLHRRMATAELGSDQLGRKLRVLLQEHARLTRQRDDAERVWLDAVALARRWQLRAGVLGGQEAYAVGSPVDPVQVQVRWTSVVGVTIPGRPERVGPPPPQADVAANSAVLAAAEAFSAALQAAAELAVAAEAARRVEAELALTRRRVRALDRRWLPALRTALAALEQSLELAEQEDGSRLRRAVAERPGPAVRHA